MSGGHYRYAFARILDLADAIGSDADKRSVAEDPRHEYADRINPLPAECLASLRFVSVLLEIASGAARSVEWYMSGDTGEESLGRDMATATRQLASLLETRSLGREKPCEQNENNG